MLEERLMMIDEIYNLANKINLNTDYYCFFSTYPHVRGVSVSVAPKKNYLEKLYNNSSVEYDRIFKTHEELCEGLAKVIEELKKFI